MAMPNRKPHLNAIAAIAAGLLAVHVHEAEVPEV
jgi:hypothetical protein